MPILPIRIPRLLASTVVAAAALQAAASPEQHLVGWGYQEFDQAQMRGVVSLATGAAATMGIREDGTVVGWGYLYAFGNVRPYVAKYMDPRSLRDARQVVVSDYHALVLQRDGTVSIVGSPLSSANMVPPQGIEGVRSISTNSSHSMAVLETGSVLAWGSDTYGQLQVPADLPPVASADCGRRHSIALLRDGQVRAWGDGTNGACNVPQNLPQARQVAAGSVCSAALTQDGNVLGWGSNAEGQLSVPATLGAVSQISVARGSGGHVMALRLDGTVACWGRNTSRECAVPAGLSNVVQVSAGVGFSAALRADGVVECWGFSANGQCGAASGRAIKQVSTGAAHALTLFQDGSVRAWGGGSSLSGIQVDPLTQAVPTDLGNVASIASGVNHCIAIRQDGTVACWGRNTDKQCDVPAGLTGVTAAAGGARHTVALKSDGAVVGWGWEWLIYPPPSTLPPVQQVACSELGATAALDAAGTPIVWGRSTLKVRTQQPADLTGLSRLTIGNDHAVALRTNGSVACWGENSRGQATPPAMPSPATQVAAGSYHSLALLADGSVSAWGWNGDGIDQATVPAWVRNATFVAALGNSSIVMIEQQDCDADDRWDAWQIIHGEWDWNQNWVLDSCERANDDLDMNGVIDAADIALILLDFGPCPGCPTDLDGNGVVDLADVSMLLMAFGPGA